MTVQDTDPTPLEAEPAPPTGISRNAVALVAICVGLGAALAVLPQPPGALTFAFIAAAWVLSVVIHEFGHAFVAWKAGDHSVASKGYLTLDPLKYTDLTTTILVPLMALALGGIGFPGAAVYLREDLMRSRAGRSLSSLAGPLGTLLVLLAIAAAIAAAGGAIPAPLLNGLAFLAFLQATAFILNLLPVPGFDGYGVIRPWLPKGVRKMLAPLERFAFLIVFGVLFFFQPASDLLFGLGVLLTYLLGVPLESAQAGMDAFRFWEAL